MSLYSNKNSWCSRAFSALLLAGCVLGGGSGLATGKPDPGPRSLEMLAGPCVPCLETREVALVLESAPPPDRPGLDLGLSTASFWGTSMRWDGLPTRYHRVRNLGDLRRVLTSMARSCERAALLKWYAHGETGAIAVGNDALTVLNAESFLGGGLHCVMAPGAEIDLNACNTGRGCRGEDFLRELARLLLVKGGSVTAATFYEGSIPLLTSTIPLNLDLQTITVSEGFETTTWDNEPRTAAACEENIRDAVAAYGVLKRRARVCGVDVAAIERSYQAEPLERIYGRALLAERASARRAADRTSYTRERSAEARDLFLAMAAMSRFSDEIVQRMEERGCGFRASGTDRRKDY